MPRELSLIVARERLALVNESGRRLAANELRLFRGELLHCRLLVRERGVPVDLSGAAGFQLAAKPVAELSGPFLAASSTVLPELSDLEQGLLVLSLSLNTLEVNEFLGDEAEARRIALELVQLSGTGGEEAILARGEALLLPDLIRGDEGPLSEPNLARFSDLDDVPAAYLGAAGQVLRVRATEDGLEFAPADEHEHEQEAVSGLAAALAARAPLSHGHEVAEVSGLSGLLAGKAQAGLADELETLEGLLLTPEARDYPLVSRAAWASEVLSLAGRTSSGTVNATILVEGVAAGGLTSVAVSSTPALYSASGSPVLPAGGRLVLRLSEEALPLDLEFSLCLRRVSP